MTLNFSNLKATKVGVGNQPKPLRTLVVINGSDCQPPTHEIIHFRLNPRDAFTRLGTFLNLNFHFTSPPKAERDHYQLLDNGEITKYEMDTVRVIMALGCISADAWFVLIQFTILFTL